MTQPPSGHPELDLPAVRRGFDRAAPVYDAASQLQREVARRMHERLDYVKLAPERILDLGCGTGDDLEQLRTRFAGAAVVGLDASGPMLVQAGTKRGGLRRRLPWFKGLAMPLVQADAAALPFGPASFDFLWSNFLLPWMADPQVTFREAHRVLRVQGLFMFATLGPDTLRELRSAFAKADARPHVHRFIDMHDLGDMLVGAGFADPVMDMEHITLTYAGLDGLWKDLRTSGATLALPARRRGLTGRHGWARMAAAYESYRQDGRLPATVEVVYGQAWRPQPRVTPEGAAIVRFDLPRRPGGAGRP